MNRFIPFVGVSALFLSACEVVEIESAADQALYNTFLAARSDTVAVDAAFTTANIPVITTAPTQNMAQMTGVYAVASTELGNTIAGQMEMNVDFANGTTSGRLHNNFIDDDGTADSSVIALDGEIAFNGNVDLTTGFYDSANSRTWQLQATGRDTLSDTTSTATTSTDYSVDVQLHGDFYDSSVIGSVAGVGNIGDLASQGQIDGNIDITSVDDTTIYDISSGSYVVYESAD